MKKGIIAVACSMALVLTVAGAQAATTYNLGYGDAYYVGYIFDGQPSSPELELGYLKNLIQLAPNTSSSADGEVYSRVGSTLSPLSPLTGSFSYKDITAPLIPWTVTVNDPAYIYGKYDGPNAGVLVWLVDAEYGDQVFIPLRWGPGDPNAQGYKDYGLSHLSVYSDGSPVPIPASLVLFGSGLIGLAGIARRKRRA